MKARLQVQEGNSTQPVNYKGTLDAFVKVRHNSCDRRDDMKDRIIYFIIHADQRERGHSRIL